MRRAQSENTSFGGMFRKKKKPGLAGLRNHSQAPAGMRRQALNAISRA
jgi:hypothetical protein